VGHILDPRTGRPAAFRGSVTVWDRRPLVADILSTALFVMGPDEGIRWAEVRGIAACYLAAGTGGQVRATMTRGFGALVTSASARMLFSG
jgi:thiamine biosynthesis lipoprotein